MERRKGLTARRLMALFCVSALLVVVCATVVLGADKAKYSPVVFSTGWALLPPVVAIALALITKEVYSSLFIGIVVGAVLYGGGNVERTILHAFGDDNGGFVSVLTDSYNVGILIFLVILGTIVAMMNKAGGSAAFGKWASEHIKTKVGAQLATILLGVLIFIDDYFNCLTVGSVMRPVTDKHNVSRAKLAYLIDATAAPVCIIAPVSSWAAAVSGFVKGEDGLTLFVRAIPYNFYAILTIVMMVTMVLLKVEFGPMAKHEKNADNGDLFSMGDRTQNIQEDEQGSSKGKVIDLVIPILCLVVCCVIGMIYTGGFFKGKDFITAFSNSDASVGLAIGSFFGLVITIVLYVIRRVLPFKNCMDCLVDGFRAMVPAILILTMAWTLKSMTDSLGAKEFVAMSMKSVAGDFISLLPAVIFLVACFLAFATGTSWGTFGILIPIVVAVFEGSNYELMIISISACMAGAVCGDHCSPISDTTIMASAGAECDHVNHVSTQLPYAIVAAAVSFFSFIIAGFVRNAWIVLPIAILMMIVVIALINIVQEDKE
ncbi:Na+/H+ antiporter NhaC family protein [uncultured Eubacterium sp.]|jgi:tetracycline resistance efflux pump|uniref:Na+/H+ antiporter NhaC family protein n=1 Tax=uncultured Eubacterium sp. TaxID=165185 RepID=UPI0026770C34|nr:Na+/H+ antiporter NhaC family protein [uncultured Eubacterium sp.]